MRFQKFYSPFCWVIVVSLAAFIWFYGSAFYSRAYLHPHIDVTLGSPGPGGYEEARDLMEQALHTGFGKKVFTPLLEIQTECPCGDSPSWSAEREGEVARCPYCGEGIVIEGPFSLPDSFDLFVGEEFTGRMALNEHNGFIFSLFLFFFCSLFLLARRLFGFFACLLLILLSTSFLQAQGQVLNPEYRIVPHPQDIFLKEADTSCYLRGRAVIVTADGRKDTAAVRLLQAEAKKYLGFPLRVCTPSTFQRDRKMVVLGIAGGDNRVLNRLLKTRGITMRPNYPGPEGYILDVTPKAVVIAGNDAQGVYYGICTLVQVLQPMADRRGIRVPGLKIVDYPDMAFRSTFGYGVGNGEPGVVQEVKAIIRRLSRLKFNMASLNNHNYPMLERERTHHGKTLPVWQFLLPLWEHCRFWHLTPRAEGWTRYFPDGTYTEKGFPTPDAADPTTLEGIRLSCMLTLKGTVPEALYMKPEGGKHIPAANVLYDLKTGQSWSEEPLIVADSGSGRIYREGEDYIVAFGEIRHPFFARCYSGVGFGKPVPRWAESDNPPTMIRRTDRSAILDGGTVRVTFTAICPDPWRVNKFRYCRSDPRLHEDGPRNYIWRFCTDPIRLLGAGQFCLSVDETRCLGLDQRCRRRLSRGDTLGRIWAEDIYYYYKTIRSRSPEALIMMWSDMIDPYHNAAVYDCKDGADRLVKLGMRDILMMPWSLKHAEQSIRFLYDRGFRVMASCQSADEDAGAFTWAPALKSIFKKRNRIGLQYTTWGGNDAFKKPETWKAVRAVAEEAWSTPPYIIHQPVIRARPRIPIRIQAFVEGDTFNVMDGFGTPKAGGRAFKLTGAWLYYRTAGARSLIRVKMDIRGNKIVGEIPPQKRGVVEYSIMVQAGDLTRMLPGKARYYPLRLEVSYSGLRGAD